MLGPINHVGYLALDLEAAIREFTETFGVRVVRRFDRPEFSLLGAFLGTMEASQIEVFTFTDSDLRDRRLAGSSLLLDHVAFEVGDIAAAASAMRQAGVRFSGPDLRDEVTEAIQLGHIRHLWTVPETSCGQSVQLLQLKSEEQI
jgi:catechol 2,3-dioxygenase-like lactoylglutathione lyase family enzyme